MVRVNAVGADANLHEEFFLLDSGADRTVLSAFFSLRLNLPTQPVPGGFSLVGISGSSPFVVISTALEFTQSDGGSVRVRGNFAAFTDPAATDYSVLGRDVLNNFDLILSWPQKEIFLLAGNHRYQVIP